MAPEALIRRGGATLAFDTNAILGFSREDRRVVFNAFLTLCDDANRLRTHDSMPLPISIVVPSLVRMEGLHDLRAALGRRFDADKVVGDLRRKNASVASFDEGAAVKASGALHDWFPSDEAWDAAKRARCMEALGLSEAPGRGGLASIDWAIAAQAEAERWILVTADTRAEFQRVSLKLTKSQLRQILDDVLQERGLR